MPVMLLTVVSATVEVGLPVHRRSSRRPFRDGRLRQYCRDRCDCSAARSVGADTANLTVKPYAGIATLFLPGTAGTRLRTASSIEPRPAMKRLIDD